MPLLTPSEDLKKKQEEAAEGTIEVAVKQAEPENVESTNDLTAEEQEMAKKHGLIDKEEKQPDVIKVNDKQPSNTPAVTKKQEEIPQPIDLEKRQEIKNVVDMELSLEEEKEVLKQYDTNSKALYFRMKKNIKQRQQAENRARELEVEKAKLQDEITRIKAQPAKVKEVPQDDDIFGGMEDDDVLTVAELKAKIAAKKAAKKVETTIDTGEDNPDEIQKQTPEKQEAIRRQAEATVATLAQQEAEFRTSHEDFDDVLINSKKIITMVNNAMSKDQNQSVMGELELEETFGSDRKTILQAKRLSVEFSTILAKGGVDEFGRTAAEVAYELGQLISAEADPVVAGAEKVGKDRAARIIANAKKTKSPASATGSGKTTIALSQLTAEDLSKMSSEEYAKVPKEIRERIMSQQ